MTSKAKREMIHHWAERGYGIPTTAKLLNLTVDEVRAVLTYPEPPASKSDRYRPEFIEPPSFDFGE
ncbi:hypothetical protein DSM100688_0409 [Bifidobacterium ramosum]|uniref:Uncharacterized protein n=1 Tax=Bifidobacterium ramosum TaxID=1798158 RepID=A0A6L4X2H4_9BIFI|nr:hypothetical protein [Bifidobacterium ramosum]KAB8289329.1 hypothetical protein DSM100688_0409 [Bifidobacterium ramosum]NEG71029.1 hypothetical protein [Bifidobacterium ramosum]